MEISNINFRDTLGRDTLEGLIVRNIVTVSRGVHNHPSPLIASPKDSKISIPPLYPF
jgi:hypothetical protein